MSERSFTPEEALLIVVPAGLDPTALEEQVKRQAEGEDVAAPGADIGFRASARCGVLAVEAVEVAVAHRPAPCLRLVSACRRDSGSRSTLGGGSRPTAAGRAPSAP
jgi:hypothetical protein